MNDGCRIVSGSGVVIVPPRGTFRLEAAPHGDPRPAQPGLVPTRHLPIANLLLILGLGLAAWSPLLAVISTR